MSDTWDSYMRIIENELASVFINLSIKEAIPIPEKNLLLRVWMEMHNVSEDGLQGEEDISMLFYVQEELKKILGQGLGATYVSKVTRAKYINYYYYASNEEGLEEIIKPVLYDFPSYSFKSRTMKDESWGFYNFLFPSELDIELMSNRKLIKRFKDDGDNLIIPREILHCACFPTADTRSDFIEKINELGFKTVDNGHHDTVNKGLPYGIYFIRIDKIDLDTINELTKQLFSLAKKARGKYDSWSAPVIK